MSKKAKKSKKESKKEIAKQELENRSSDDTMDDFDRMLEEFMESRISELEQEGAASDVDDQSDDDSNCQLSDSAQVEQLCDLMSERNWLIDDAEIEKNVIHVSNNSKQFVLYLFFGEDGGDNAWLGDEANFANTNYPLWFTEDSHTISPVFLANNYIKSLNADEADEPHLVVVMMRSNYVINPDDMLEQWEGTPVVSYNRLYCIIENNEDLALVTTQVEDVGHNPNNAKRAQPQKVEEAESSVKITNLKFEVQLGNDSDTTQTDATYFQIDDNSVLFFWVDSEGEYKLGSEFGVKISDEDGCVVVQNECTINIGKRSLNVLELSPIKKSGYYDLRIYDGDVELYSERLYFKADNESYEKYIDVEGFGLYRTDASDCEGDYMTMMERGTMSCFNYERLAGVLVTPLFKNITGKDLPYQFVLTVENEQGDVIYKNEDCGDLDIGEEYVFNNEVRGVVCPTGNYTIIVKFFCEVVLVTDFVVGRRDVNATFKVNQIISRAGKNSVKTAKIVDPMKRLNSMIGLDDLKAQLRKHIAKIEMDQLRKAQGLPVKLQQLHMAFLGNPGTGKTTVAKLLGQIYKEIGVLSKGHVVLEDRSTLMTQNWGGEGEMVNKALEKAQGGILFIDEAYDLITEHKSDPGKLIISALLQAMSDENNRDFMVIFAGYTLPMERLLSKNPGLRSRCQSMYFQDYKVPELMQIADLWLGNNCYSFTSDARNYFESIVASAYASRTENFGNARYVVNLLENEVQPAMAERVMEQDRENMLTPLSLLTTIEACDIPNYVSVQDDAHEAIAKLDNMVGLGSLKTQIRSHLSLIRFVQSRRVNKIDTPIPPLHMVFTGNPGTGKTSVAEYLGDIYRSMGLLSVGNVIKVTRADMIDSAVGGTEEKMKELLNAAHGNILFIDEAYTLFSKSGNDVGKNAVEVLLDALGKESVDMIVVLAGYPNEMEELLGMNPGLKGRFPHTFHFEDYDEEELFEIAEGVVGRNSLTLTKGASEALKAMIRKECKVKDSNFSNARFVVRLITTQVLPNMAVRLEGETDPVKLKRILQRDIPIEHDEIRMINENLFDEEVIEAALERLDAMVGLTKVKIAIHQFVDFARAMNRKDPTQIERYPLKWSFVGNTGTGKSSVAAVLSEILKAMHLLGKGHTVEVKAEELYGVATYKADELLQKRMRESLQGLLFVDGDAPQFRASNSNFNPDYLRVCLAANTNEIRGRFAVVIAEQDSPAIGLAKSLNSIGISNFNHTLIFDDYTAEELMAILTQQLAKHGLSLSVDAASVMYSYIQRLCTGGNATEANARTMKELARTIRNISSVGGYENYTIPVELVAAFAKVKTPRTKIGY